jgi:hypothetical protein
LWQIWQSILIRQCSTSNRFHSKLFHLSYTLLFDYRLVTDTESVEH